jgi:hypothetical protein
MAEHLSKKKLVNRLILHIKHQPLQSIRKDGGTLKHIIQYSTFNSLSIIRHRNKVRHTGELPGLWPKNSDEFTCVPDNNRTVPDLQKR